MTSEAFEAEKHGMKMERKIGKIGESGGESMESREEGGESGGEDNKRVDSIGGSVVNVVGNCYTLLSKISILNSRRIICQSSVQLTSFIIITPIFSF